MLKKIIFITAIALGLTACSDEALYSGLTEKEANEIIALLSNARINSSKNRNSDERYTVSTSRDNFPHAVELLKINGYPRNRFESLGEVFKKEGFVSSPLEERARLNYAQSQELSKTIESIDGVILARVHLAIPKGNKLDSKVKPSSASVFIKHRRGIDLTDRESQIKALIVNSIEGLPYENVTVAMFSSISMPVSLKQKQNANNSIFSFNNKEMDYILISLSIMVFILFIFIVLLLIMNKKQSAHLRITNTEM